MSIEKIVADMNAAGFKINNLFQLDEGFWRCNLRSDRTGGTFYDFANGTTMLDALRKAAEKTKVASTDDVSDLA